MGKVPKPRKPGGRGGGVFGGGMDGIIIGGGGGGKKGGSGCALTALALAGGLLGILASIGYGAYSLFS